MGCDIHTHVEVLNKAGIWEHRQLEFPVSEDWKENGPFQWRNYGVFAVLAGVRNYSAVPQQVNKHKSIPKDASPETRKDRKGWGADGHSPGWFTLQELLDFPWDSPLEDRRYNKQVTANLIDGGSTCEPGQGEMTTYREFVDQSPFWQDVKMLKALGDPKNVRIVFWFDN